MNKNNKNSDNLELDLKKILKLLKKTDELIAKDPKNEFYHLQKSYLLYFVSLYEFETIGPEQVDKRFEEALKEINIAIGLNPNISAFYFYKAIIPLMLKKTDEALKEIDIAIELNPNKMFYYFKGHMLFILRRYEEALEEYNKALSMDPNDKEARKYKIEILMLMQNYEDVLEEYDKILAKNPNDEDAHFSKAIILTKLKRFEEAEEEYRHIIFIDTGKIIEKFLT